MQKTIIHSMPKSEVSCCFTGHRPEKMLFLENKNSYEFLHFKNTLDRSIQEAICSGYCHFFTGMSRGMDMWAAQRVIRFREAYKNISLEAVIPFDGQDRGWQDADRDIYRRILSSCDKVTVLSPTYVPGSMYKRNRYMVDRSSLVIAAFNGSAGGTRYTCKYAKAKGIKIINIFDEDYYGYMTI